MSVAARGQDSGSPGPNLVRGGDFEGEVGEFLDKIDLADDQPV